MANCKTAKERIRGRAEWETWNCVAGNGKPGNRKWGMGNWGTGNWETGAIKVQDLWKGQKIQKYMKPFQNRL